MQITKTLYVTERKEWRAWLKKHHATESDIWLIYYRKDSGKPRIPYNDAVEEALCFGWIDSILKKLDPETFAQRFSPRNPRSQVSPLNKERIWLLIKQKKMRQPGLDAIAKVFDPLNDRFKIPEDILEALKKEKETWANFQKFPESYKRIRIGWIDGARNRPEEFKKRLKYFLKMTAANKRFGMTQEQF